MFISYFIVLTLSAYANCIYGDEVTKPAKRQELLQWPSAHKYNDQRLGNDQRINQNSIRGTKESLAGIVRNAENFVVEVPKYDDDQQRKQDKVVLRMSSGSNNDASCPSKETGQYPYRLDCRKFINCWKGRGFVQACAPGTLFNPESLECDFPAKVNCLAEIEEPDYMETGMIDVRLGSEVKTDPSASSRGSSSRTLKEQTTEVPSATFYQTSQRIQSPSLNQPGYANSRNLGYNPSTRPPYSQPFPSVPPLSPWLQPPPYQPTQNQPPTQSQYSSPPRSSSTNPNFQQYSPELVRFPQPQENPSQQYPQQNPSQLPPPFQQHSSSSHGPIRQQYPSGHYTPPQQYPPPSRQYIPPMQPVPHSNLQPPQETRTPASQSYRDPGKRRSDCSMPGGTGLAPHPTDCAKFLNCWKGKAHTQPCGTGTLFNAVSLQCDFPNKVDCRQSSRSDARGPTNQDPAPGKKWPSSQYDAVQLSTTQRWIPITTLTPELAPIVKTPAPISYDPFDSPSTWPRFDTSLPPRSSSFIDISNGFTHPTQRPPNSYQTTTPIATISASSETDIHTGFRIQQYYDAGTRQWRSILVDSFGRPIISEPTSSSTVTSPPTTTATTLPTTRPPRTTSIKPSRTAAPMPPTTSTRPSTTTTTQAPTTTQPPKTTIPSTTTLSWRNANQPIPLTPRLSHHSSFGKPSTATPTSTSSQPSPTRPPTYIMSIPPANSSKSSQSSSRTRSIPSYSPLQTSGQVLRLRGGAGPHEGHVEVQGSTPGWGLVCDEVNKWTIAEATVVCRQLGFVRGAELSWQGRPIRPTDDTIRVSVSAVACSGNEATFDTCRVKRGEGTCLIARDAAGVKCYRNHVAHCQPGEVNHDGKCYSVIVPSEVTAQEAFTHGEALADCQKRNAKLLDINSQSENDFISEWLLQLHPQVNSVITSGIVVPVMGHSLWIWEGSGEPFTFHKWWPGWTGTNTSMKLDDVGHHMQCVVAKRVFPCMSLYLPDVAGESNMCEANYFYWDTEDCSLTHDHPYVCERPIDDVGCIVGVGRDYNGNANVTISGLPCLSWDSSLVPSSIRHTISDRVWNATLAGHNHCRNVGGAASEPGCYAGATGQYESCDIPICENNGLEKAISSSNYKCSSKEFECQPNECVLLTWLCDGERDCKNGRDEKDCSSHLAAFKHQPNKHLVNHDAEKWLNSSADLCAKRCIEAKAIKCKSFNHHSQNQVCVLSVSNVGLSGQLHDNEEWQYFELEATSVHCHDMFKCDSGKCVNKSMVCNGRNDCGDRSDENDCSVKYLDYDIRLSGGNNSHEGRVEIRVFGQWGSICDDLFGLRDAEVVCRELGFNLGAAEFRSYSSDGANPVYLVDDLQCRGNETTIRDCEFDGWGVHDCGPEEVIGVTCRVPGLDCAENYWRCDTSNECIAVGYLCDNVADCDDESDESDHHCESSVELRLVDGPNSMSGRVEVRYHGVWGTVCDDDFTQTAAQVICRSLGYNGPAEALKDGAFGPGEGQIWLDQLLCIGNETKVEDCRHAKWGENNCGHEEDAAVICTQGVVHRSPLFSLPSKAVETPPANTISTGGKEILPAHCGLPMDDFIELESERVPRVLGGHEVLKGSLPWQASIRVRTAGKSVHWCGAVVLSPLHVLTAGHCMVDYMKGAYFVRAGDHDSEASDNTEQEANIEEIYIHEDFNVGVRLNNDIALVKLKPGGLRLNQTVQPICLPPTTVKYTAGINCSISGWGSIKSAGSGFSRTLRSAYVPILPDSTCTAKFVYGALPISAGMVCAGQLDGGSDSCQGDSGGPLICMSNGRHTLYGITSWGHGCGRINKPGVYSRVGFYRSWIDKKLQESMGVK